MRDNKIIRLFTTFFKIGLFTFGGGLAMLPLIQRAVVEKENWITEDEMLEMVAISESTPGPIAINTATFVGYRVAGVAGAIVASLGVVVPSFSIITAIALLLSGNYEIRFLKYAFFGLRAGVIAILINAIVKVYKKSPKGAVEYCIMLFAFLMVAVLKVNVFLTMIVCAVIGLISFTVKNKKVQEETK